MRFSLKGPSTLWSIGLLLTALFIFTFMNALAKVFVTHYPVTQIIFFRTSFALLPILFLMKFNDGVKKNIKTGNIKLQLTCGFLIFIGFNALFFCFRHLPLADAQAISFSSSLFVVLLASPLAGETVGIHRWMAVCIGFIGILVIIRPSGHFPNYWGAFYGLTWAFSQALIILITRVLLNKNGDGSLTTAFYTNLVACFLSIPFLIFFWDSPTPKYFLFLIFMGICSGISQLLIVQAFKYEEASFLSPFFYFAILLGILLDYIFWSHIPHVTTLIGSAIVIFSSLYLLYQEKSFTAKTR